MNKLIIIGLIFLPCLSNFCNADLPPSQAEILQLKKNDSRFFREYEITSPLLCLALIEYRKAAISRNVDHLYSIRTEPFKKVVSREVFETQLLNNVKMPTEILYSKNQSIVTEDTAKLNVFYFQTDGNFDYVITSTDQWKFDTKHKQWLLVSNSLSWGSSIVK
jgi:hypothetical protein